MPIMMDDLPHSPDPSSGSVSAESEVVVGIRAAASHVHELLAPLLAVQDVSTSLPVAGLYLARAMDSIADLLAAEPGTVEGSARNLISWAAELHTYACAVLAERLGSRDRIADDARVAAFVAEDSGYPVIDRAELQVHRFRGDDSYGPMVITVKHEAVTLNDRSLFSQVGRWWSVNLESGIAAASIGNETQVRLSSLLSQLADAVNTGLSPAMSQP
jgi:hypothetical protein